MVRGHNPDHTPAGAAITELILTIFRTNGRLLRTGDRMVRDLKLTSARWQVIGAIDRQPRTVAQIAREFELSRQGVLWVVQSMAKDGLIEFVHNPDHRRAKLVQLTEAGLEVSRQVSEMQCEWANDMGEAFGLEELEQVLAVLRKLGDVAIERDDEEPA